MPVKTMEPELLVFINKYVFDMVKKCLEQKNENALLIPRLGSSS